MIMFIIILGVDLIMSFFANLLSPQNIQAITAITLLFFAYVFSITISGNIQAYVAKKCGDSTADDQGFTEFNPFLFLNLFDIAWFLLFKIMIGRPVPLELRHGIDRRHRWWRARVFLIFSSRIICNIAIATIALLCGGFFLMLGNPAQLSILSLLNHFCIELFDVNVFLATFECCRQTIHFFILYKLEKDYRFIEYADYILVLGPLAVWLFFGETIKCTFQYITYYLFLGITTACGVN